jgi:hypothetical protein
MTDLANMTPNDAWEKFVGDQSLAEFIECSATAGRTDTVEDALLDYILCGPMTDGLSHEEMCDVYDLLITYMEINL